MLLWQVIAGRVITGLGGAGMIALVSVIITGTIDPLYPTYGTLLTGYRQRLAEPSGPYEKLCQCLQSHWTCLWGTCRGADNRCSRLEMVRSKVSGFSSFAH